MLREAADLLRLHPMLASGTLWEGDFRWICASLVTLGVFASWCTERPMFACRPDMRQHVHPLYQHCLELWTR